MGKKKKILMIVDSPTIQKIASFSLKSIYFEALTADDGMKAIELLSYY